jgi:competence protein ComEC
MSGLILLYPYFQSQGRKGANAIFRDRKTITSMGNMVTDSFAITLSAIITTWPLIAYNFGIISLVALPATFFSLPALPAIITTSILVALAGLFAPLVAQILGWLAWLFLSYLLLVIQVFDALPHSSLPVAAIPAWQVWVYYAGLAVAIAILNHRKKSSNLLPKLSAESK